MNCHPEVLLNHTDGRPRVSVILIDWAVRESFHALECLNRQTIPRDHYELLWLEFYDHKPAGLHAMAARANEGRPFLDKWIVLGYPREYIFHKHRLYNVGILAAEGEICIICDSDAVFAPTFIENIIKAFRAQPNSVVHVDEVRNNRREFYPFNHPTIEQLIGPGSVNWRGHTTLGLDRSPDRLHDANYGACMAARRQDLLAIGGADEDLDYLGYICGPYELTFRLRNHGCQERWLTREFLYHSWHPNQNGINTDYHGPHDGGQVSLLALDAIGSGRVAPILPNPWFAQRPAAHAFDAGELIELVRQRPEPSWVGDAPRNTESDRVYWTERNFCGFNIFYYAGSWWALRVEDGALDPDKLSAGGYRDWWKAESQEKLHASLPFDRISILFCTRRKDNPASELQRLLDSVVATTTRDEQARIEFLIKFDDDDDERLSDAEMRRYPFDVRTFVWSRGEGRHSLHHAQEYLFAQRDRRSRFCLMTADDFFFTRPGWVSEILSVQDEFCVIGYNRPHIELFALNYENDDCIRRWVVSFGELSPVISTRLIEVTQNFGWQSNVDSWIMGLCVALYNLYGVILWRTLKPFYERRGGYGLGDTPTYNNMELTSRKGPENRYWFELVRRQARNVWLNMKYGTDLHSQRRSRLRRLWWSARAEPLWRLPYRVVRKIYRTSRATWTARRQRDLESANNLTRAAAEQQLLARNAATPSD